MPAGNIVFYQYIEPFRANALILTNICLFKVNNENTRKRCEICSKLTIETPEDVVLATLSLNLNIFRTFFQYFYYWLWTAKCLLGFISMFSSILQLLLQTKSFCTFCFCLQQFCKFFVELLYLLVNRNDLRPFFLRNNSIRL